MANSFTVTSHTVNPDGSVTIIGTVNGQNVTINPWLDALQNAFKTGGSAGLKTLIATMMLNSVQTPQPVTILTALDGASFSQ